jgi:hypothetical protein
MISKFIFFFIGLLFCVEINAQNRFDFGLFGGVSSYMGDINPTIPFYNPMLAYGGIINYTFSTRYMLRSEIYKGTFVANDLDFKNDYQRLLRQANFNASLVDISIQLEFNFLPYMNITKLKDNFAFFVTSGVGYTIITGGTYAVNNHLTIPMGIGVKYNLFDRFTVGTQCTIRKTFVDRIDGIVNYKNSMYNSAIHNFDWYMFGGVFFTYKLFYDDTKCPAYWNN